MCRENCMFMEINYSNDTDVDNLLPSLTDDQVNKQYFKVHLQLLFYRVVFTLSLTICR